MSFKRKIVIPVITLLVLSGCSMATSSHREAANEMVSLTHKSIFAPMFSKAFASAASKGGVLESAIQSQLSENVPSHCISDVTGLGTNFAKDLLDGDAVNNILASAYEESLSEAEIREFNKIVSSEDGKKLLSAVAGARWHKEQRASLTDTIRDIAMNSKALFSRDTGPALAKATSKILPAYSNVITDLASNKQKLKQEFALWVLKNPSARDQLISSAKKGGDCAGLVKGLDAAAPALEWMQQGLDLL